MNRFVSKSELRQIDLGDGDWVKIPARISYGTVAEIGDAKGGTAEQMASFLSKIIREWNLTDADGAAVGITPESIKMLDVQTVKAIADAVTPLMQVEKKA